MSRGWGVGNRRKTKGAHSLNRRHFVKFPNYQRNKEWLCVNPPFLFFKKLNYICLMVTDIFSHWKKTELCLENFLGGKMLKQLIPLINSMLPSPTPRTQPLWHIIFPSSGLRSHSILHRRNYCPLPSQASVGIHGGTESYTAYDDLYSPLSLWKKYHHKGTCDILVHDQEASCCLG